MSSGAFRKKKTSFAQVSNSALRDETLSLKAKGLLALIESYLSLDNFTLYKQFLINKSSDGETAFRSAWKELKDKGYLIQHKLKNEDTKQFYYEYEICDNPHVENPPVDMKPMAPDVEIPLVANQCVEFPHSDISTSSVSTKRETHSYNNNIKNNTIHSNTLVRNIIHTNIDYDPVFVDSPDKGLVDNIVDIMVDIISNDYEVIRLNGGEIRGECLKPILLKANMHHILYTVKTICNYPEKIINMRMFILSVLYNSVLTLDCYYQNLANT